jgi:hypothetical protein
MNEEVKTGGIVVAFGLTVMTILRPEMIPYLPDDSIDISYHEPGPPNYASYPTASGNWSPGSGYAIAAISQL